MGDEERASLRRQHPRRAVSEDEEDGGGARHAGPAGDEGWNPSLRRRQRVALTPITLTGSPMRLFAVLSFLVLSVPLTAQSAPKPPAAISAIREADLERDLYIMAGDEMRGREAGTIDEMHASMWVADQLKKIGVDPLGGMGSW